MAIKRKLVAALLHVLLLVESSRGATFESVNVALTSTNKSSPHQANLLVKSANQFASYLNKYGASYDVLVIHDQNVPKLTAGSVSNLNHISVLNITSCGIAQVEPGTFHDLPRLIFLNLDHNRVEEIQEGVFAKLTGSFLSLAHNRIRKVQPGAFAGSNFQVLDLSHNALKTWDSSIVPSSNLNTLMLDHNDFQEIRPKFLGVGMEWFRELDLSHNRIKKVCDKAFEGVENFQRLSLAYNPLEDVQPGAFYGVRSVHSLDFGHVGLEEVEDLFKNLNVKRLNLEGNELKCLEFDVGKIAGLERVYYGGNPLKSDCVKNWVQWKRDNPRNKAVLVLGGKEFRNLQFHL